MRKKNIFLLLFCFSVNSFVYAQINVTPQYPNYGATPIGHSYTPGNPFPDQHNYFPQLDNPLQTMREQETQRIKEQNQKILQQQGFAQPPNGKVDFYDQQAREKEQKRNEIYHEINAGKKEFLALKAKEEQQKIEKQLRLADHNTAEYKANSNYFFAAAKELNQMLVEIKPTDLKRAVFTVENAWYENTKSYETYCAKINDLVTICKEIAAQEKLDITNPVVVHYVIQKLFSETVVLKKSKKTIFPLGYDFDDFWGDKDYSKQFVIKLLETNTGQCHSLPLLYLILAQELKAQAWLTFAPNHSFVKFPVGKTIYGFECTNGTLVTDDWIVGSGFISSMAIKNKIYLYPAKEREMIAHCLSDLSQHYFNKFGYDDFTVDCNINALKYFPNYISALQMTANAAVAICADLAKKYNYPAEKDYYKYPDLKEKYDILTDLELEIERAGFVRIPPEEYEKWRKTAAEEKQRRTNEAIKNKMLEEMGR